ncbi:response regulator transcription factor [Celeribacter baekdonensis]|uniref:DNA-binding response regulator n=1 Tax=Celeribacter baekdonensis TaxID=875171 RepID=A0A2R4M5I2_9RHOB|nr:response regulator transcription factor [Celeribacter baekdonensis]AVW92388.1 DNA-binding response regulator [Celeribacter baekdonensis]
MSKTVYLLEDDPGVAAVIERVLVNNGFTVQWFQSRVTVLAALRQAKPDVFLVDLGLPDADGLNLIREEIGQSGTPIIIVSGRGDIMDRIVGLELGADDYIVKPFEPRELVARVRAVLRRSQSHSPATEGIQDIAKFAGWTAYFASSLLVSDTGDEIHLSTAENTLLRIFVQATGRILSREALLNLTAGDRLENFDRSVDVRVSRLRRKLKHCDNQQEIIRTIYGAGYVFVAHVEWCSTNTLDHTRPE